jgi:hypothetical protein
MDAMNEIFKLNCGDEVKDRTTGATGTVVVRGEALSGNIKYAVRPKELKDGKPAEAYWIDEDALEVKRPSKEKRPDRSFLYTLGTDVKDRYSDAEGVIVFRCDHQYACTTYEVQPRKISKAGVPHKGVSLDEKSIVVVAEPPPQPKPSPVRTGAEDVSTSGMR